MPWVICLGLLVVQGGREKQPNDRRDVNKHVTFKIIERVPIHRHEHAGVWRALRESSTHQLFVDVDHPEEAMPGNVLSVVDIKSDQLASIEAALATARRRALGEEAGFDVKPLARALDQTFEQQREWLAVRALLARAITRPSASTPPEPKAFHKSKSTLILVDA